MVRGMLSFRVDPADAERLEALAGRFPVVPRSTLARAALRIGMARIERQGLAALEAGEAQPTPTPSGAEIEAGGFEGKDG